jgi:acetyl-CoA carboxylase beta subunit
MAKEFTEYRECPKCGQTIHRRDYGSQAYCKRCWHKYLDNRKEINRLTELYDQYYDDPVLGPKLKAQLETLTAECQGKRAKPNGAKPNLLPPVL